MRMQIKLRLFGALTAFVVSTSAFGQLCVADQKTEVLWKGSWYKASVVKAGANRCFITYAGYDNSYDEWVGPERLRIKVLWKGDWYPAAVVSKEGDEFLVSYDGYKSSWDEVVSIKRIQLR
ncbi:MAG: agenet domain-containing protein [Betaproteobacteria bacterium]